MSFRGAERRGISCLRFLTAFEMTYPFLYDISLLLKRAAFSIPRVAISRGFMQFQTDLPKFGISFFIFCSIVGEFTVKMSYFMIQIVDISWGGVL